MTRLEELRAAYTEARAREVAARKVRDLYPRFWEPGYSEDGFEAVRREWQRLNDDAWRAQCAHIEEHKRKDGGK